MKLMTFLAGVATGVLLKEFMGAPAGPGTRRPAPAMGDLDLLRPAGPVGRFAGAERDYATHAPPRSDEELCQRIRSQFGRTIGNPQAIQVEARDGCVTLRGQVQARDCVLLMAEVETIPGVHSVRNELDIQGSLEDIAFSMTRDKPAVRARAGAASPMSSAATGSASEAGAGWRA